MKTLILLLLLAVPLTAQEKKEKSPIVASLTEAVIPGAGHLYNEDEGTAIVSWAITVGLLMGRDRAIATGNQERPYNAALIAFRAVSILTAGYKTTLYADKHGGVGVRIGVPIERILGKKVAKK